MHARLPHDVPRREPRAAGTARRVASLLRRPAHRRRAVRPGRGRRGRRRLARRGPPDREGRLARHRLAHRVRRPGAPGHRPVHLLRRDPARRRTVPLRHHQHGRADDHALRHRGAEVLLPAQDPRRRGQLRHRLHRARGRHRPGLAAHPRRARRRGVRCERRQDLHLRRRRRRLRLARHPHQSRRAQAQGHFHPVRAHNGRRLRVVDHQHGRRADHDANVLRQRARAAGKPGRGGERGLAHDHEPAQPRARRPGRLERSRPLALRGRRGVGGDNAVGRGPRGDRAAVGADGPGQVQGRARGDVALELAHGRARGRRRADRRRVVVDQGVRDGTHPRGRPPAVGRGRRGRLPDPGLARCTPARPPRGDRTPGAGQHVRRRGQRGAARDRRRRRPRHDAGAR